ncbi:MAG: hypothetical protein ACFFDF_22030, partial [Candidatus Odinarchaeota archaeon]
MFVGASLACGYTAIQSFAKGFDILKVHLHNIVIEPEEGQAAPERSFEIDAVGVPREFAVQPMSFIPTRAVRDIKPEIKNAYNLNLDLDIHLIAQGQILNEDLPLSKLNTNAFRVMVAESGMAGARSSYSEKGVSHPTMYLIELLRYTISNIESIDTVGSKVTNIKFAEIFDLNEKYITLRKKDIREGTHTHIGEDLLIDFEVILSSILDINSRKYSRTIQAIGKYRAIYGIPSPYEDPILDEKTLLLSLRKAFSESGKRLLPAKEISRMLKLHEDSLSKAVFGKDRAKGDFTPETYLRKLFYLISRCNYIHLDKQAAYDAIFEYAEKKDYDIAFPTPEYIFLEWVKYALADEGYGDASEGGYMTDSILAQLLYMSEHWVQGVYRQKRTIHQKTLPIIKNRIESLLTEKESQDLAKLAFQTYSSLRRFSRRMSTRASNTKFFTKSPYSRFWKSKRNEHLVQLMVEQMCMDGDTGED